MNKLKLNHFWFFKCKNNAFKIIKLKDIYPKMKKKSKIKGTEELL